MSLLKHTIIALLCCLSLATAPGLAGTVTDAGGRIIRFEKPFTRIISLYGAHTENLFHLALDKEIIGVSVNDRFPGQVDKKPRFSYHDDPEKFLAAKPDLVLIRPMIDNGYPDFVAQLERYRVTVVSLQPANVREMFDYWHSLGALTGKVPEADHLIDDFKEKISRIRELVRNVPVRKKVYFEAIHSRMKTFSSGSMPIYALETAGGINLAADAQPSRRTNIANYGKERILAKADQIDIFLAQKGIMNPIHPDQIFKEPGFKIIKAIKAGQVYLIDENIVSRPVPRLYQGIVTIGNHLYPEIFSLLNEDL